jgi:tetratricopeptide (TPR) repeat protein
VLPIGQRAPVRYRGPGAVAGCGLDATRGPCDRRAAMGFFDRFRPSGARLTPEQLRDQLFDAVAARDAAVLAKLCEVHEEVVLAAFAGWKRVPETFRAPDRLGWYGQGLIAVAQHFAQVRGRPELLQGLVGPAQSNPLVGWQRALAEVQSLMKEHRYAEAVPRLRTTLEQTDGLQGSGADAYRPVTHGHLGQCLFQLADADAARAPTEQALRLCEAGGDDDGVLAYLASLYEIHRYRGDAGAAADCLDRRGAALERLGRRVEAARCWRQAAIVRAGEPLCRVVVEIDGARWEVADAPAAPGRVQFVFERNRIELQASADAVDSGTAAAQARNLEAALELFRRAARADRFNPWPSYHAGMALLESRRYAEAVESYQRTEALAPGWYHCRSDRWLAERLAAGEVDHAAFQALRQLVDGRMTPDQAVALAEATLARCELGAVRLALGDALAKLGRRAEAEAAYRQGLAGADEPDVRTRLLVALASAVGDRGERRKLLHAAIELSGNLVSAAVAAVMLASTPGTN